MILSGAMRQDAFVKNRHPLSNACDRASAAIAQERRATSSHPVMNSMRYLKLLAAFALVAAIACPAQAKLAWNKKAKKYDPAVTGCTACHVDEKPKKDEHGKPLTERGQWLLDQKAKQSAKDVNLEWLKDYPNNGK
jgi:hypothetical protein